MSNHHSPQADVRDRERVNARPQGSLDFYRSAGRLSAAGHHSERLKALPHRIHGLVEVIQHLCIYDVVAKDFYGVRIPEERTSELHIRSAEELIDRILALDPSPLTVPRPPEKRLVSRCRSFVQLLVTFLRYRGVPARARCGFGAYFNPPNFEDHWTAEYWDEDDRRWKLVDVQFDERWREALKIEHDVLDVPRDQFLVAADGWKRCRNGDFDADRFGIEFVKLRGLWFIAGSLIRDLAALNRMELLPWDVWGTMPKPNEQLDEKQVSWFDRIAEITRYPDDHLDEVTACYRSDGLAVPESVFNSLLDRWEKLG